jgi:hypothetical protein
MLEITTVWNGNPFLPLNKIKRKKTKLKAKIAERPCATTIAATTTSDSKLASLVLKLETDKRSTNVTNPK